MSEASLHISASFYTIEYRHLLKLIPRERSYIFECVTRGRLYGEDIWGYLATLSPILLNMIRPSVRPREKSVCFPNSF